MYPRLLWVGRRIDGMGASAQRALAPDGNVYLLHEGGCSLLQLRRTGAAQPSTRPATSRSARGETVSVGTTKPATSREASPFETILVSPAPAPVPTAPTTAPRRGGVIMTRSDDWTIVELARRPWDGPKNDFRRVAFDATGVWILPAEGPLIRAPLPRPRAE